jgi:hypothetical protein
VWRAQTQVLLGQAVVGRPKCALPGCGKRLSRAVQRARRRRPVVGHTPVGRLAAVWGSTAVAGVLYTAATWVVSTGDAVQSGLGRGSDPRLVAACGRQARIFWGGLRCLAGANISSQKKALAAGQHDTQLTPTPGPNRTWLQLLPRPPLIGQRQALGIGGGSWALSVVLLRGTEAGGCHQCVVGVRERSGAEACSVRVLLM